MTVNGIGENTNHDACTKETYHIYPQLIAGSLASVLTLLAGMAICWSSFALPKLLGKDSEFQITYDELAWIVTGLPIGGCFGPILSLLLVDRIGRKWFLYGCAIPYFISWIMVYFAQSFLVLFVSRIICGFAVGGVFSALPIYLSEIAEVRIRGAIGFIMTSTASFGTFLAYILGSLVTDSQVLTIINIVPVILFALLFFWMPETPYYYLKKNQRENAEKSLVFLRKSKSVHEELQEMAELVNQEIQQPGKMTDLVSVRSNRNATFISLLLITSQQASGLAVMLSYVLIIFKQADTNLSPDMQVVLTAIVTFIVSIVAACVVDRFGKKPLFITSAAGCATCLCAIGVYFLYQYKGVNLEAVGWVPLVAVLLYYVFFYLGLGPVPYSVISEIYPTPLRANGTMIASIFGSGVGVVVTKLFQIVAEGWGYHTIFFIMSGSMILLMCISLFTLPETKGKTFNEIQEMLAGRDSKQVLCKSDLIA